MAKRALLVGCNYPGTKGVLHGFVKEMGTALVEQSGFDESDILLMLDTDPSTPRPTPANILSALKKLINSVKPGDELVFYYSCERGWDWVPPECRAPGESDTEEAILPTDINLLTYDDVRELVNQIPAGVTFTYLASPCHFEGMIDNKKEQIGGGGSTTVGGGGSEYYEAEGGGGRGYGAGEEGYRGEEYQNFNHGRRNESEEEGGYGGYGRTEAVSDYHHQSQQGGYGVVAQPPHEISINIPVDVLTQILSQRTGQNVQVGNIRTTISNMFGDQASSSIKMFVKMFVKMSVKMLLKMFVKIFST